MKIKELKNMSASELQEHIVYLRKELFELRQQSRLGQVENPARFGMIKKEIAQAMTIINEGKKADGKKS